jgi:hypothetical protein
LRKRIDIDFKSNDKTFEWKSSLRAKGLELAVFARPWA